jgi:hypothetical protein
MSKNTKALEVGDVITCPKFQFGYWDERQGRKAIFINEDKINQGYTQFIGEEERVKIAQQTGKTPPKTRHVDRGANSPKRATAKFVVETAQVEYQDHQFLSVFARRLNINGKYDQKGELIHFCIQGPYTHNVPIGEITKVGKMQMMFV